jgi:hypothetical protein
MTATTLPAKGTIWKHARRKDIDGEPVLLTVTSITNGKVYSRTKYGSRVKTPVENFAQFCLEIVSVPEPKPKGSTTGPKFGEAEAKALFLRAQQAGLAAAEKITPVPMYVVQRENPLDDSSRIVKRYAPVMSGVCGFAWIIIKPGNGSFARHLKKLGLARTSEYYGGVMVSIFEHGQSYEKKLAHAAAFADVLKDAGVKAMSMGRLD